MTTKKRKHKFDFIFWFTIAVFVGGLFALWTYDSSVVRPTPEEYQNDLIAMAFDKDKGEQAVFANPSVYARGFLRGWSAARYGQRGLK